MHSSVQHHPGTVVTAAAVVIALAACSSDLLGPDFGDDLVQTGACADVWFYAVDTADRVMLTFNVDGLVAAARVAGESTTTTFDLPDPAVTLIVEQGSRISDAMCDDVIENGGPQVDRTWTAVVGKATVTIRPGTEGFGDQGDLRLEQVVFDDGHGHHRMVDELVWTDMPVGWFPG